MRFMATNPGSSSTHGPHQVAHRFTTSSLLLSFLASFATPLEVAMQYAAAVGIGDGVAHGDEPVSSSRSARPKGDDKWDYIDALGTVRIPGVKSSNPGPFQDGLASIQLIDR